MNSSYRINGARSGQNLFLLNGAPISDPGGSWQVAPNVGAVQEFNVMTNTYGAPYGRFRGGVVNTVSVRAHRQRPNDIVGQTLTNH